MVTEFIFNVQAVAYRFNKKKKNQTLLLYIFSLTTSLHFGILFSLTNIKDQKTVFLKLSSGERLLAQKKKVRVFNTCDLPQLLEH